MVAAVSLVAVLATTVIAFDGRRVRRRLHASVDDLAATNERVRRLLDGLPDAVLGIGADGAIVSANERAAAITGRPIEDLLGRSFIGFVAADDRRRHHRPLASAPP